MVKIICGSCSKPLSIDETKLPMREVSFPCPLCKTKLKIDRSQLPADGDEPHRAEVANAQGAPSAGASSGAAPSMAHPEAQTPAEAAAAHGMAHKALIVGESSPDLEDAARAIGCSPIHRATPAEGREYYVQEFPEVVFLVPSAVTAPPMDELVPMTSIGSVERRRGFFILVGDKFRSLDGNAAFLYGVNLVVARKELSQIGRFYQEARKDHDRLTRSFMQFAND